MDLAKDMVTGFEGNVFGKRNNPLTNLPEIGISSLLKGNDIVPEVKWFTEDRVEVIS